MFVYDTGVLSALAHLADALHRLDAELDACDDETLACSVRRLAALQTTFQAVWLRTIRLADERALSQTVSRFSSRRRV